ncbi:Flp/Fap pilin component [Caballeronia sordidicola]|uniref:Flp/Fap pilin component n=1 Tax=Caballeronia sordidicola TaxID=196367 RepID=A0A158G7P6_CABSO|nr:Flp family type IVb pilin [Caballeronia sordidicola]SAL28135.1 Flp/Fap pilin component [Caballeronia sordidicola]
MFNHIRLFIKDERGVTAIEYGLIAGIIAVAIVAAVTALGANLTATFAYIGGMLPH